MSHLFDDLKNGMSDRYAYIAISDNELAEQDLIIAKKNVEFANYCLNEAEKDVRISRSHAIKVIANTKIFELIQRVEDKNIELDENNPYYEWLDKFRKFKEHVESLKNDGYFRGDDLKIVNSLLKS